MPLRIMWLGGLVGVLVTGVAAAQEPPSPYAAIAGREIKALSAEAIAQLEAGDGMSLALAAELNGYPGPKHVLELADSLGLSGAQRARIEEIRQGMLADARRLGAEVVSLERELDRAFAARAINAERLEALTAELGRLAGALRFTHLRAHLLSLPHLTDAQRAAYVRLRGYAAHAGEGHGHHE